MTRFVVVSLAVLFSYCILQCSGFLRGPPSSSSSAAASSGCDTRTRLAKLNCSCALSKQHQNCLLGTNSFCINGKCSCRGNNYPDWSTGFFCRESFRVTSPRTGAATNCAIATTAASVVTVPYGTGAASQAARYIIHENAAGTVTCTPSPASGATTKVAYTAMTVNSTHTELLVKTIGAAAAEPVAGTDAVTYTCVDGRGVTQVVTVSHTISTTATCT